MKTPFLTLTIPGRPTVLKNNKRIFSRGRGLRAIVLPSERFVKWESEAAHYIKKTFKGHLVDFECEIHFKFFFSNRQAEADVSNLIEGPADLLQKTGVVKNDKLFKKVVAEKFFGEEPRTEIEIFKL